MTGGGGPVSKDRDAEVAVDVDADVDAETGKGKDEPEEAAFALLALVCDIGVRGEVAGKGTATTAPEARVETERGLAITGTQEEI
jgi:hypothetical protein